MTARLNRVTTALAFFSRFPVPARFCGEPLLQSLPMAPLAGVLIALPAAALMVVAHWMGAQPLLSAALATVAMVIATGALHEDGLADCADGFWGGATRERRLEIMHDSRVGTYGVLALVAGVLLKVAILQTALSGGVLFAALSLIASAAAARAVALYAWTGLGPARADGLAVAVGRPTISTFRNALLVAIAVTAVLTVWWAPLGFVLAAMAAAAAAKGCASLADAKIGGHTGDVIGAGIIVADLSYLLVLTIWTV
ncbi:adenosylcobinamide-GDP ribazoletransferase [Acuticoccus sp. MNP-M23]|uniref:adenosylcobinamide-GDP ribazoletransferase n=1 Tax=Acuticoccus sp. MNP-M23 TaxID=3072793 RepID=UPI002815F854|nr:adenosylcobinamide-GDP ribazoletransferase [Acuticoccus sp. MNP-M23]WMS42057.1 adenosylcobinamide-GDP ribazoletransferase [Acuticoccus sp. MNP-M23]